MTLDLPPSSLEVAAILGSDFLKGLLDPEGVGIQVRARIKQFYVSIHSKKVVNRAEEMLRDVGESPREVHPKRLMHILENASLEDNPELQERWAALLANEVHGPAQERDYTLILRNMTATDARILDIVAGENPQFTSMSVHASNKEIALKTRAQIFHSAPSKFESRDIDASLDNLERLGLIRIATKMRNPNGAPDSSTDIPSDFISLSMLGLQFIIASRPPRRAD